MHKFERIAHSDYFEARLLPEAVALLSVQLDDLRRAGIKKFGEVAGNIIVVLLAKFIVERKLGRKMRDMDNTLSCRVQMIAVSYLNKILPLDYPFVFSLLVTAKPDRHYDIIAMHRRSVPGVIDWLNPGNVPFYFTKNDEEFAKKGVQHIRTFFPESSGDGLEPGTEDKKDEQEDK